MELKTKIGIDHVDGAKYSSWIKQLIVEKKQNWTLPSLLSFRGDHSFIFFKHAFTFSVQSHVESITNLEKKEEY